MMTILKAENLNKTYPNFSLKNVSFQIEQGTIMGFVGKNGAGKSTTIKAILNMIHTGSGRVEIFGKDFWENETECKGEIGVVMGGIDFYLKKKLSMIKNVTKTFYGEKWDEEKYKKYISAFEIDDSKKVDQLSSGMRVKFMIALALSHNAKLLILDEPTSGLDPVARDDLCNLFRSLVQNGERSIFFSTHITSDLEKCATHITFIKDGAIINSLPIDDMMEYYSYLKQDDKPLTLEDIIVSVERKDYDDKIFD
jgi:ABC-2 type transport system ATP-binding protein